MTLPKKTRFPIGHGITLAELDRDPYPAFARLREREPISWIPVLNMWYVVGYEDVRTALLDTARMTTVSAQSTIFDTFGAHVLTTEGATHDRYRQALRHPFAPGFIRPHLEPAIVAAAAVLIDEFEKYGQADLRSAFASRLPIQVILFVCGLPADAETQKIGVSVAWTGPRISGVQLQAESKGASGPLAQSSSSTGQRCRGSALSL